MTGYCMSVRPYFREPQVSENTAQECNIQPYCLLTHQILDLLYTTVLQQEQKSRQLLRMRSTKVVATCIFNELQGAGLFQALDGTSMCTNLSTSERKYHKLVTNAVFIHNERLFIVSAATTSAFQSKHMLWLIRSICPAGYISNMDH